MPELTREQLLEQVRTLQSQLAQRVQPHAQPHDTSAERTVITETPRQTKIETTRVPPQAVQPAKFRVSRALVAPRIAGTATPEEIVGQIRSIKSVIRSGVDSAASGDKRTDFRSLAELRQILADLEEELEGLLGIGGRTRQIRMTTQWDKGL